MTINLLNCFFFLNISDQINIAKLQLRIKKICSYFKYNVLRKYVYIRWVHLKIPVILHSCINGITLAAQHQIYGVWKTLLWNRFSWIKYKYNAAQSLKVLYQESTGYNVHQRNITNTVQSYMYKSLTFIKFL